MKLEMVGRLDECFLLSYGIDPAQAAGLVPAGLELITCRGAAFFNIVICHVDRMRARFTPRALGVTYWHIAYRVQVRATLADDRPIEGLYFLRSDIDRPVFGVIGTGSPTFTSTPRGFDSRTATKRLGGSAWSQQRATHWRPSRFVAQRAIR